MVGNQNRFAVLQPQFNHYKFSQCSVINKKKKITTDRRKWKNTVIDVSSPQAKFNDLLTSVADPSLRVSVSFIANTGMPCEESG